MDLDGVITTQQTDQTAQQQRVEVTPFDVGLVEDYTQVVRQFGCEPITSDILDRFERITGTKIPNGYRNFIISHRDFDKILTAIEEKKPVYLYTGRGPSSDSMHIGHLVPFRFCQYLQLVLKVPVVIQITDDEKFIFKPNLTMESIKTMAYENIKDIIACGFDVNKTFIFTNTSFIGYLYPTILKIQKVVNLRQVLATFGFPLDNTPVGKVSFPCVQAAPAFAESFESIFETNGFNLRDVYCLIPCAIDQDPYFRMCRGISSKIKHHKPAVIHTKFMAGLQGVATKMSSSYPDSCIYLGDSDKQIRKKIGKAFSGGKELLEEHRKLGGDPTKDVAYNLLTFFSKSDTLDYFNGFSDGSVSCGEMKKAASDIIIQFISEFKQKRSEITEVCVSHFTDLNKKIVF
jgi:tryptophanyl-tRNA synthetase